MSGETRGRRAATARRAGPRRSYHHGNLRRALLDAALSLVEREGAEALTLRAAARRAGVSQAAPYRHFRDKDALLAAVAEEGFRAMTEAMSRATVPHEGDPLACFRARGMAYIQFATSHPAQFKVMFGRVAADRFKHPGLMDAAQEAFRLLVAAIRDCQQAGVVRGGDPEELALCAWSATHGLSALAVEGQLSDLAGRLGELAQAVATNVYLGLGPRLTGSQ
jgi:AcrR family transcriptional regulator